MSTEGMNQQIEPENQENKIQSTTDQTTADHQSENKTSETQPKDDTVKEHQPIVSDNLGISDQSGKSNPDPTPLQNTTIQEDLNDKDHPIEKENSHDHPHQNSENVAPQEARNENKIEKDQTQTKEENPEVEKNSRKPSQEESDNKLGVMGKFKEGMLNLVASVDKEKPENSQTLDKQKKSTSKDKINDMNKLNSKPTQNTADKKSTPPSEPEKQLQDSPVQEQSRQALVDSFATIGNFFSITKDNVVKQSSDTFDKITEIFMKSKFVATCLQQQKQDDLNYSAIITSDIQGLRNSEVHHSKPRRKNHEEKSTEQQQQSFALSSGSKLLKNLKSESSTHDQSTLRESNMMIVKSKIQNPKTSFSQSKERSEGKPKNEIEEQIRQHKIQEIIKMKKNLEAKLSSLNDQLVELQKSEQSPSPAKTQPKKKETKDEFFERQRQAKEFANKMKLERKALEIRSEKRREARQIQVTKDIDVLQQNRAKNTEVLKVLKHGNKSIDPTARTSKAAQARSALEERKQDLKAKREFEKNLEGSPDGPALSHSQEKQSKSKVPNKSYKSPMLPQVLAQDAEFKRAENEKINKRKNLHEKQVEYAKEVKESFLPKLKSKHDARKLKMGIYKSHNVETYLAKVAKERLFENPIKPKPKYSEEDAYTFKKTPIKSKDISRNSTHTNDEGVERKNAKVNRSRYEEDDDFSERTSAKRVNPQLQENFMFGEAAHSNKSQSYINSQGDSPVGSHNLDLGLQGKKIRDRVLGVHSSQISEPNTIHSSHRTPNKRSSLVKGYGDSENWKEELQQDQAELKKKISGMLDDIKKMENHVKNKEEKISKDIDTIKAQ